jgi:methylmalonyl-CoA mutase N-terminal domain/subunit
VNEYKVKEDLELSISKPDPEHARSQIARLKDLKKTRDQQRARAALEALRQAAKGEENLMPYFIEAVKVYATLGEICGVLREVFGEYQQDQTIR